MLILFYGEHGFFGQPKVQEAYSITIFWFLMENSMLKISGSVLKKTKLPRKLRRRICMVRIWNEETLEWGKFWMRRIWNGKKPVCGDKYTHCVYISFSILVCLPKKVLQMYSDIWLLPDFDSEKWLSSLFSMRLNWKTNNGIILL